MLEEYSFKSPAADGRNLSSKGAINESGDFRIEVVHSLDHLSDYADSWNHLAFEAPHHLPTLSYAWIASYLENLLLPAETWSCILAFEADKLVGVLPVIAEPFSILGLKWHHIRTPHNKHSFSIDFLAVAGKENQIIPLLLSSLLEVNPRIYDIVLHRLPAISPTLAALIDTSMATIVPEYDGLGSYMDISGTYDDYRKKLGHNFSRNLTKARNKLAKLADVRLSFLCGRDASEKNLEQFLKVESSGWKGKAGTAIQASSKLISYYSALTRRMSQLGWLEWHFLEADNRVIAAQMAARINNSLIILKIGYDEEYSYCSPGNILFERTVERAYERRDTNEINCITDMPWHNNWAMQKRAYHNLWIYPRRPLPWLLGAAGRRAKIGIRRIPGAHLFYRELKNLFKGGKP